MLKTIIDDFELLDSGTISLWSDNIIKFEVADGIKLSITFSPNNEVEVPEVKSEIIDDCLNFTFIGCDKSSEFEFEKPIEIARYYNRKLYCYLKIINNLDSKPKPSKTLFYYFLLKD